MNTEELRMQQLKAGRTQWGHAGKHHGNGSPDCPRELHHHHDAFCKLPTPWEMNIAGVKMPEGGWHSRAG